jgi:tetratricopeptide (TPR) repeat protein
MRRFAAILYLLAFAHVSFAEDKWEECRSGPFEVWTNDSDKKARELLVRLEQIRHMLGVYLGRQDLESRWTIRVLLEKGKTQASDKWTDGRNAWVSLLPSNAAPGQPWQRELVRMLVESNVKRIAGGWEDGLIELLSTLEAKGPMVTIGIPVPGAAPGRDWARVQMLATNPEYSSRLRVLMNNLQNGADENAAYRNSYGKTRAEIEKMLDAYMAAGKFTPVTVPARAMSERDFYTRPVEQERVLASLADVTGNWKLSPAGSMESAEGLGLAAAREGRKQEAQDWLKQAIAAGSKSARVHLAYGKLLADVEAKRKAFVEAAKLNAKWPDPYVELANTETTAARQAFYLKTAASLEPRDTALWQRLGTAQLEAGGFAEASKSWFAAELAAPTEKDREAVRQARRQFEEDRAEREAAERKRIADERQAELDRLKQEALNRIREAEAKANKGPTPDANRKVEDWWDDKNPPKRISGVMEKVDCLGKQARVWIRPEGAKPLALRIKDPSQIVIIGGGSAAFGCGVQKPARAVNAEYKISPDAKLGTAGDLAMVEFR